MFVNIILINQIYKVYSLNKSNIALKNHFYKLKSIIISKFWLYINFEITPQNKSKIKKKSVKKFFQRSKNEIINANEKKEQIQLQ